MKRLLALPLLAGFALAQAPAPDPGMKTLVQVAIVTRDIDASAKRWAAVLGLPVPSISTTRPGNEVKVVYKGKASTGQAKLTFFKVGQVVIELLQPIGKDTSWKEWLDQHGESVQHLGFNVENLEHASAAMEGLGYKPLHSGRYDKDNGTYSYFDSGKDLGVVIELLHSDSPKK